MSEPGNTVKIEILTSPVKFQPWLQSIEGLLFQKGVDHCIKIENANANEVKNKGLTADEPSLFLFTSMKELKRIGSSIELYCIFALNALQAIEASFIAQTTQFDRSAINNAYIHFKMQENESIDDFVDRFIDIHSKIKAMANASKDAQYLRAVKTASAKWTIIDALPNIFGSYKGQLCKKGDNISLLAFYKCIHQAASDAEYDPSSVKKQESETPVENTITALTNTIQNLEASLFNVSYGCGRGYSSRFQCAPCGDWRTCGRGFGQGHRNQLQITTTSTRNHGITRKSPKSLRRIHKTSEA
ncbi:hypothetical protein HK096_003107 [Nowakowskiella sp. JEL0078]|nr:hypothetical protein HK096_003107 [Nowakowskiella sp. JEL0078]